MQQNEKRWRVGFQWMVQSASYTFIMLHSGWKYCILVLNAGAWLVKIPACSSVIIVDVSDCLLSVLIKSFWKTGTIVGSNKYKVPQVNVHVQ